MAMADWLILAVLLVSVLTAVKSGFLVEIFSLSGAILGLILASWNYQRLLPWIRHWIPSHAAAEAVSFLLIALGVMVLAGLVGRILRWSARSMGLGWLDRILGALFGVVKGFVIITIAVLVIAAFFPKVSWFRHSRFAPYFLEAAHRASAMAPAGLEQRVHKGVGMLRNDEVWIKPASTVLKDETQAGYNALKKKKRGN